MRDAYSHRAYFACLPTCLACMQAALASTSQPVTRAPPGARLRQVARAPSPHAPPTLSAAPTLWRRAMPPTVYTAAHQLGAHHHVSDAACGPTCGRVVEHLTTISLTCMPHVIYVSRSGCCTHSTIPSGGTGFLRHWQSCIMVPSTVCAVQRTS